MLLLHHNHLIQQRYKMILSIGRGLLLNVHLFLVSLFLMRDEQKKKLVCLDELNSIELQQINIDENAFFYHTLDNEKKSRRLFYNPIVNVYFIPA